MFTLLAGFYAITSPVIPIKEYNAPITEVVSPLTAVANDSFLKFLLLKGAISPDRTAPIRKTIKPFCSVSAAAKKVAFTISSPL